MRTLLLVAAAAAAMAYAARAARPLDGSVWDVKVRADSFLAFGRRDTLIFDDGRLTVAGYAAEGFAPAAYSAARDDAAGEGASSSWHAWLQGPGRQTAQWRGSTRGGRIDGSVLRLGPDGRTKRYTFKGTRKPDVPPGN